VKKENVVIFAFFTLLLGGIMFYGSEALFGNDEEFAGGCMHTYKGTPLVHKTVHYCAQSTGGVTQETLTPNLVFNVFFWFAFAGIFVYLFVFMLFKAVIGGVS
jgi:hypothetical protein